MKSLTGSVLVFLCCTVLSAGAAPVSKISQSINFSPIGNKTYGDTPVTLTATASSGLPVVISVVNGPAVLDGNTLTLTGAGSVTLRASQAGGSGFKAATTLRQFRILPAPLTARADNQSQQTGLPIPPLTISFEGFVNGDDSSDLAKLPVAKTKASPSSNPGSYPITLSGGKAANYVFQLVPGNFQLYASSSSYGGGLIVVGSGTLTLGGSTTYTGGTIVTGTGSTRVTGGTLNFGGITNYAGGTLNLGGNNGALQINIPSQTVPTGSDAVFTAPIFNISGASSTTQWRCSTDLGVTWINLVDDSTFSGTQTSRLTVHNVDPTLNGALFTCTYFFNGNPMTVTVAVATLTVQ